MRKSFFSDKTGLWNLIVQKLINVTTGIVYLQINKIKGNIKYY